MSRGGEDNNAPSKPFPFFLTSSSSSSSIIIVIIIIVSSVVVILITIAIYNYLLPIIVFVDVVVVAGIVGALMFAK